MSDCKNHENTCNTKKGANFTAYESGATKDWPAHTVELPGLGEILGKLFLKDLVGFTGCEISINSMAPGAGMPIYHQHQQNEEVYIFIQGKGQVQVDGEVIDVQEGTIVRIAPNGERIWRNNSSDPLLYIIIQVRENSLNQHGLGDAIVPEKAVIWPN
jgi:mannose-6-phosphate isomerase-like protein (cupin superfamily)